MECIVDRYRKYTHLTTRYGLQKEEGINLTLKKRPCRQSREAGMVVVYSKRFAGEKRSDIRSCEEKISGRNRVWCWYL